jgi:diadenosine tetraphosphate (Ap4A) HIT family hydrolase
MRCRVVYVEEPGYAGFSRVIWQAHVKEMTDLPGADRQHLMHVVFAVESVLRHLLSPAKVNLASLGNMTPHIHWHVIPRFSDDPHFPQPIWGSVQRGTRRAAPPGLQDSIAAALGAALNLPHDDRGAGREL